MTLNMRAKQRMSREEKPENKTNIFINFWNGLDKNIRLLIVGAVILYVLYDVMSPLQQCKREKSSHGWCYANTSW